MIQKENSTAFIKVPISQQLQKQAQNLRLDPQADEINNKVQEKPVKSSLSNQTNIIKIIQTYNCLSPVNQGQLLYIQQGIYKPCKAIICPQHLHYNNSEISLNQVDKIKVYPNKISTKYYQIKINIKSQLYFFAAEVSDNGNNNQVGQVGQQLQYQSIYPQHFQWFKNLLIARLQNMGTKLKDITQKYPYTKETVNLPRKIQPVYIQGFIYKKSKYWKKWQKRYVQISKSGLYSFKGIRDINNSFEIKANTIKQIWTRFECLDNNQFLIIKIMGGENEKAEIGIPLASVSYINKERNWLYQIYRIMQQGHGVKLQ